MHTIYSYDGTAPVSAVLRHARQIGLNVIAITDHDEIKGSLKALELAPRYGIEVLLGIEITTAGRDLLAYNILQKVERNLPLIETILKVGELAAFVSPHTQWQEVRHEKPECLFHQTKKRSAIQKWLTS
jgi:predicted metal-dependent phosphoesterase TrpH